LITLNQRELPTMARRRLPLAAAGIVIAFAILAIRLWQLQVMRGEELRLLSDNNRIRLHRVQATRGTVVDRFGHTIVDSRPSFDAVLVPEDSDDLRTTVENLSQFLRQSSAETQALLRQAKGRPAFQEVTVKRDLSWAEVMAIETHQLDLPGVSLRITPRRSYPFGSSLSHVLGYVSEINAEELAAGGGYRLGDLIGKSGLERRWEEFLRGVDGGQQVEVDAVGRKLRVLREVPEVPGNTLTLSFDVELQAAAEAVFEGKEGAAVALDPRNGEILALVSSPSYDPNLFARGIRREEWRGLVQDPLRPLTDRAVQGQYPPGSTFKIIVAAAALEEGVVNPFTRIRCGGGVQFGNHYFRCWKKGGHGSVNLHEALVHSCDTYFYQVGQRLGIDAIADWSFKFGLGQATGVDLDHEKRGTIPSTIWKRRRFQEPWYPGETLSNAIGQGYVTATPLQMAQAVGAIATGNRYRPHFVKRIQAPDGETIRIYEPERVAEMPLRKSTLEQLRQALRDTVARGTGNKAAIAGVEVAGKTGTSQVISLGKTRLKPEQIKREHRDHAWFVAFAPVEEPEIAVAVVVEHALGGGGAIAAPAAKEIIEAYFRLQQEREDAKYADVRSATRLPF
jgi:penicillin-binding protein 2